MTYPIIEAMLEGEKPKKILEVGCSAGRLFEGYKEKGIEVSGIELFDEYREEFTRNQSGKFYLHDAHKVPWPIDEHYDITVTVGFFSILVSDPLPIIKEMLRLADKVILAEWHEQGIGSKTRMATWAEVSSTLFPVRTARDYVYILNKIGRTPIITQFQDKWIIKV